MYSVLAVKAEGGEYASTCNSLQLPLTSALDRTMNRHPQACGDHDWNRDTLRAVRKFRWQNSEIVNRRICTHVCHSRTKTEQIIANCAQVPVRTMTT